jgi:lipopolysaccharide transport system ATP-binding protein
MSSDDLAVSVAGLGKDYRIGALPAERTLTETVRARLRAARSQHRTTTFTALDDVTFDVPRGEVLGVIGRNGAGKSTLLKVLTRITPPSRGEAILRGKVGALLEVGTGFHPELTGRENMYLNGAVLGMRSREVDRRFDSIVEFAGIERFLDTPVKRYSSGMYVRLAFALAAHLDVDVLLVDEVLAVGDQEFQERSLSKMRSVATDGRTVVLVSHQLHTVATLCDTALYLRGGQVAHRGPTRETIARYLDDSRGAHEDADLSDFGRRPGSGEVRLVHVQRLDSEAPLELNWRIRGIEGPEVVYVSVHVVDSQGLTLLQCDSRLVHNTIPVRAGEEIDGHFVLRGPALKPGRYRLDMFVCRSTGLVDVVEDVFRFDALPVLPYPNAVSADAIEFGLVLADFRFGARPAVTGFGEPGEGRPATAG